VTKKTAKKTTKKAPARRAHAVAAQFLDPARINTALSEVATATKKDGVKVALVGGAALQLYGSDRFTTDLDVVASGYPDPKGSLPAKGVLTFGGVQSEASNGVPVDVIVRDDERTDLYDAALDNAQRVAGVPVPVVTLPYLGAMKLASGRAKDIQDLEFILRSNPKMFKQIRKLVTKYLGEFEAEELDSIQQAVEWKESA
jgi:hypothetical protein